VVIQLAGGDAARSCEHSLAAFANQIFPSFFFFFSEEIVSILEHERGPLSPRAGPVLIWLQNAALRPIILLARAVFRSTA